MKNEKSKTKKKNPAIPLQDAPLKAPKVLGDGRLTEMPSLQTTRTIRTTERSPVITVNRVAGGPTTAEVFEQNRKTGGTSEEIGGAHRLTWKAPKEMLVEAKVVTTVNDVDTIEVQKQRRFDTRGELQKVRSYKVSFMNISDDSVVIHASTPLTLVNGGQNIATRVFGFKDKGKFVSSVHIKPGKKAFYTVSTTYFTGGLRHMENIVPESTPDSKDRGVHHCMCDYAVVVPNQPSEAGLSKLLSGDVVSVVASVVYDRIPLDQVFVEQDGTNVGLVEPSGHHFGFAGIYNVDDIYGYDAVNLVSSMQALLEQLTTKGLKVSSRLIQYENRVVAALMVEGADGPKPLEVDLPEWARLTIPGLGMSVGGGYNACTYAFWQGRIVLYDEDSSSPHTFPRLRGGGSSIMLTQGSVDISYDVTKVPGVKTIDWGALITKVLGRLVDLAFDII